MEGNSELLRMELTELNTYARHNFQLLVSWYTFFLTINFGVIGWFTSVLLTGALKASLPIIFITAFFLVQIILSYLSCLQARKHFEATHNRCNELLNLLCVQPSEPPSQPRASMPFHVYSKIITLMFCTLISFGFFWIVLLAVTLYLVPL